MMDTRTAAKPKVFLARALWDIGVFSAVLNVLLLVMPLYMLQIYDRVLPSSNAATLVYLSVVAVGALVVLGLLEIIRSLYASRVSARLDRHYGANAFLAGLVDPKAAFGESQPLRHLATIRSFINSRALFFLFDLPFSPFFIAILIFIHPVLFYITLFGGLFMVALAVANQAATARVSQAASEQLVANMNAAQTFARSSETIRTLGMIGNFVERWGVQFSEALASSDRQAMINAWFGGISRAVRMLLQIAVLGAGAYLVLAGEMTAGMIFAASIVSARALQPIDQIIGGWRQVIEARRAWSRLKDVKDAGAALNSMATALPLPVGAVKIEDLVYFTPGAVPGSLPFIKGVSLAIEPGQFLAVVGASGAGKSTLIRLIVGALRPFSGVVRLDGADVGQLNPDILGRHLGYLAQDVELFPGTIAQNIARFSPDATDEMVVEAAKMAHCHDLILAQPAGYDTLIGQGGVRLSGGEHQKLGLARALFGNPCLLVLDEPNAHLDAEGEQSLEAAILRAKARGSTIIMVTHRLSICKNADRMLFLNKGRVELFGPAADVMATLVKGQAKATGGEAGQNPGIAVPTGKFQSLVRAQVTK